MCNTCIPNDWASKYPFIIIDISQWYNGWLNRINKVHGYIHYKGSVNRITYYTVLNTTFLYSVRWLEQIILKLKLTEKQDKDSLNIVYLNLLMLILYGHFVPTWNETNVNLHWVVLVIFFFTILDNWIYNVFFVVDRHDITEILLNVALNTNNQPLFCWWENGSWNLRTWYSEGDNKYQDVHA